MNTNKYFIAVLILLLFVSTSTANTPLYTCSDLQNMSDDLTKDYCLANNIDCAGFDYGDGKGFMPIALSPDYFSGTFDGQNYTISNLYINRSLADYGGLFGRTRYSTCEIKNVGLYNINISGKAYTAGLIGYSRESSVFNCHAAGVVNADEYVGGLIGRQSKGSVSDCYTNVNVISPTDDLNCIGAGGLIGILQGGNVSYCNSTGNIVGMYDCGGLIGICEPHWDYTPWNIRLCYATGDVTGWTDSGGMLGFAKSIIESPHKQYINNSYATGDVFINGGGLHAGGGLVGFLDGNVSVYNSYSIGNVTGSSQIGGLVGKANGGTAINSYWDIETSGVGVSDGGTGKTTTQMKQQTTFSGWDFINTWVILEGITYPSLIPHTTPDNDNNAGFDLSFIITILGQIPDILTPIPTILAALAEVAIYGAIIGLVIGIVYGLRNYTKTLTTFRKGKH